MKISIERELSDLTPEELVLAYDREKGDGAAHQELRAEILRRLSPPVRSKGRIPSGIGAAGILGSRSKPA